ncbi:MAG: helix-turn-helix domain-containing protein [Flavobacteriales bacterium]|nr:helix-turn-helix domain-containing protein [Flavobacteriales bacterium]MCW8912582.1 helix-turn-helix domain-containing protein [Flavobacteriales bacterium]MCW8938187.1 helix-turn-helix domain-containing protein [Flavobacteriales bacterium]MCW8941019.1 helix-turn-helix domain-containing protein [Flavobacteriales bacterium]MCW8967021.1 helix-turn-helix domain-containing protein [Flavobacteriales bacterium]
MNKTEFNSKFGAFVKSKREKLGLSQSQLAARIGNNYQNISRLERGEISPTLYWCSLLAEAFEMELDELISDFVKV